jgi:RimJ/RimL family protein N-acetyltransferase
METDIITLRPVQPSDAEYLFKWYSDKENVKFMGPYFSCTKFTKESIEKAIMQADRKSYPEFMVFRKGKEAPIGYAALDVTVEDFRGQIYDMIGDRDEQGKGYGKQITKLLVDMSFNELGLNSLEAYISVRNKPSLKAAEKAGFIIRGVFPEFNRIDGEFVDELALGITRKEYEAMKKACAP